MLFVFASRAKYFSSSFSPISILLPRPMNARSPHPITPETPVASTPTEPLWLIMVTSPGAANILSPCSTKMVSRPVPGMKTPKVFGPRILVPVDNTLSFSTASRRTPSSSDSEKPLDRIMSVLNFLSAQVFATSTAFFALSAIMARSRLSGISDRSGNAFFPMISASW